MCYYLVSYLWHLCYVVQGQAVVWMDVIDDSSSLLKLTDKIVDNIFYVKTSVD